MRSKTKKITVAWPALSRLGPLALALALGLALAACESESSPSDTSDASVTNDGGDPGPVDTAGFDQLDGADVPADTAPDAAPETAAGPDSGAASLPACGLPQGHQPNVTFEAVDTDAVNWRSAGLTDWEGDVTVASLEPAEPLAAAPDAQGTGWSFALDTGAVVYSFHVVLDGHEPPFAAGDALHAKLHVFEPEFYVQTAQLTLTDAAGALVFHASQGTSCGFPVGVETFSCADEGDCGNLQGRGDLRFGAELAQAPALAGATVPDRAATTVGAGAGAYLVLAHDVWDDPNPDAPPGCADELRSWCQLAILPAPTTP